MRIWLAYKADSDGANDPFTQLLPVGLGSINAVLREAGYASRVVNLSSMSHEDVSLLLTVEQPDVIALSQFTHNRHETIEIACLAKKIVPGCFVALGGPHASHRLREQLLSSMSVDAVVIGEGEATMLELVQSLSGSGAGLDSIAGLALRRGEELFLTPLRGSIQELDSIATAARYFDDAIGVDPRRQLEFIVTSRGCPGSCRFCSSPGFWGKGLRFRSPASMVDEIRFLRDRYGLIYFSLRDDTFTADRERVREFCRQLKEERLFILWNCQSRVNAVDAEMLGWMKRAGCECLQLGIESGSKRILEFLGKKITPHQMKEAAQAVRKAGINLSLYLIAGTPGEDDTDIETTCKLIEDLRPNDGQVSPLVYYPGTLLFDEAVRAGKVRADLFEIEKGAVCRVRQDGFTARSTRRLLDSFKRVGGRSAFTNKDFTVQKELLGYCHATNLLFGEFLKGKGDLRRAEKEYREIASVEPDNPWGQLALGELYCETGRLNEAEKAFKRLAALIPAHAPAYWTLGDIVRMKGDSAEAKRYYQLAQELEPNKKGETS